MSRPSRSPWPSRAFLLFSIRAFLVELPSLRLFCASAGSQASLPSFTFAPSGRGRGSYRGRFVPPQMRGRLSSHSLPRFSPPPDVDPKTLQVYLKHVAPSVSFSSPFLPACSLLSVVTAEAILPSSDERTYRLSRVFPFDMSPPYDGCSSRPFGLLL